MTSAHYAKYPTWKYRTKEEHAEEMREWRRKNPEESRRRALEYRNKNLEARRAYCREWYQKNKHKQAPKSWERKGIKGIVRTKPELCECCGKPPNKRGLHLDHCHDTNHFRGWLCSNCNTGIGLCGDNIEGLQRAIDYLRKFKGQDLP